MIQTFIQGYQLGPGDLFQLIRGTNNALVTPASITYSIYTNPAGGTPIALLTGQTPATNSTGIYYVNLTVPNSWYGPMQLQWSIQEYSLTDPSVLVTTDFFVDTASPIDGSLDAPSVLVSTRPQINQKRAQIIVKVRELLSDQNPDRNYHLRPPTPARQIAGYSVRTGFIWTDTTIMRMLELTVSQLNLWNPKAQFSWTIDTAPVDWLNIAAIGAAAKCLSIEGARWAAEEFAYSLNGVSLDLHKYSAYQALAESYRAEFEMSAPLATANRPGSAGLRQQRWLLG